MADLTGGEALQRRISSLGSEVGRYFWSLENDLYSARALWQDYKALFGENKERVDLLNSISGSCSFWIERCMFENLMIMICRLSDPEVQMGRTNITVWGLPSRLSNPPDEELDRLLEVTKDATIFARDWRNKKLGHSDLLTRTGSHQLKPASRCAIRAAIDSLAKCVQRFARLEMDTTLITHPIRSYEGDTVEFLTALYLGKQSMAAKDAARRKAIDERRWEDIEDSETVPGWLSFRPPDEFDV